MKGDEEGEGERGVREKGKRNIKDLNFEVICYVPRGRSVKLEGMRKGKNSMS